MTSGEWTKRKVANIEDTVELIDYIDKLSRRFLGASRNTARLLVGCLTMILSLSTMGQSSAATPTVAAVPAPAPILTLWPSTAVPATASSADNQPVELGVKFRSDISGYVAGVRFYKSVGNTGVHIGHLWDTNGVLLGLYRMDDATVFSIDVAVAKSRNVIWFSNPAIKSDRLPGTVAVAPMATPPLAT